MSIGMFLFLLFCTPLGWIGMSFLGVIMVCAIEAWRGGK